MAMRDVTHIAEELQGMSTLLKGLQETLLTKPFSDLPEPQRQRDPRDVILDKNTVLGGSLTSIRISDRDELTHFLEEFQWLKQEMEACARGASECRVLQCLLTLTRTLSFRSARRGGGAPAAGRAAGL
jgi:hypothetical protein